MLSVTYNSEYNSPNGETKKVVLRMNNDEVPYFNESYPEKVARHTPVVGQRVGRLWSSRGGKIYERHHSKKTWAKEKRAKGWEKKKAREEDPVRSKFMVTWSLPESEQYRATREVVTDRFIEKIHTEYFDRNNKPNVYERKHPLVDTGDGWTLVTKRYIKIKESCDDWFKDDWFKDDSFEDNLFNDLFDQYPGTCDLDNPSYPHFECYRPCCN
jgi:hypothetical protein